MIIILGMPGAGKTTQTNLLAKRLGCPAFSMGELIRQAATGEARQLMLQGKIIDDATTISILARALSGLDLVNKECIVDGNPRSIIQANWWLDQINTGKMKLTAIIHLATDQKIVLERIAHRGRLDDSKAVMQKRLSEYGRSVVPTIAYLRQKGQTVHEIDGNGSVEAVAESFAKVLRLNNAT